ncbi:MAG: Uma2 family endonuclease [Hyphomonadaceae bacterium]|nr:Uma2 family endonuclease [Hyphomonadaceae bacterium]
MADAARLPNVPARPKTLADFLVWEEAQADKHEFRNGQITMMTGGTQRHNLIAGNIFSALNAKLRGGPCRPYVMNGRVALEETEAGYYPDVVVDCGPYVGNALATSEPTVVFEVLSPTTRTKDFAEKVPDYRDTESMRQIVLVEPDERKLYVWKRTETGWRQSELGAASATLELPSLNIALTLDEIYEGA